MQPSWRLVRAPTRIGPTSPRMTQPYQTLASSPKTTSPTTTAVGATKTDRGTSGVLPPNGAITGGPTSGARSEVLGIPFPEILGVHLLEVAAQFLRLLLRGFLGRRRFLGSLRGLLEDLVDHEDRDARAERDRDGVARPRVDGNGAVAPVNVDVREEGGVLEVGDDDARDLGLQGLDHGDAQVVGQGPRVLLARELHVDRHGLVLPDPDRQHARALDLLKYDHGALGSLVDRDAAHADRNHAHRLRGTSWTTPTSERAAEAPASCRSPCRCRRRPRAAAPASPCFRASTSPKLRAPCRRTP